MIDINALALQAGTFTAITAGLTWVAAQSGIPSKWLPLTSLVFGLAVSSLLTWPFTQETVLMGIMAGLMASGAYDHVMKTKEIVQNN